MKTRDDLILNEGKLQILFSELSQHVKEADEYRKAHPEIEIPELTASEKSLSDELQSEIHRIVLIDGGAEILEACRKKGDACGLN